MWSDYFFYLVELPETERNKQIAIMLGIWLVLLIIGIIVDKIKKCNKTTS